MSVLHRTLTPDVSELQKMNSKLNYSGNTSGKDYLSGEQRFDRSCAMENRLCKNLMRSHNAMNTTFTEDYLYEEEIGNSRKLINFKDECENVVSNYQKINIRRPYMPMENGLIPISPRISKGNVQVQKENGKILNRDKLCSINFDLQDQNNTAFNLSHNERSPVLHQRFGRRLVPSKSFENDNKSELSTIAEVSILKPRKPSNNTPGDDSRCLPDLKPRKTKRHSYPPTNSSESKSNVVDILHSNNNLINLPDLNGDKSSVRTSCEERRNVNSLCSNCSDDDFDVVSDNEDNLISSSTKQANNHKVFQYLEGLKHAESDIK